MSASAQLSGTGQELSEQDLRYGIFCELDQRAGEIEAAFKSTWVELADLCLSMETGSYWKEGGYTSFHSWLKTRCPCSRSWAYVAMGARKELKEITAEELRQMPLSNAEILRKLPEKARRDKETIIEAQTLDPEDFLPTIVSRRPELALEVKVKLRYTVTASQANVFNAFFAMWRMLHSENLSNAEILEAVVAKWMLENQSDYERLTHEDSASPAACETQFGAQEA